jgi:hypothetical protein
LTVSKPKKRGRKANVVDSRDRELVELRRQNARLAVKSTSGTAGEGEGKRAEAPELASELLEALRAAERNHYSRTLIIALRSALKLVEALNEAPFEVFSEVRSIAVEALTAFEASESEHGRGGNA